jgi:hypothetical protein
MVARRPWGFFLFCSLSALGLLRTWAGSPPAHYALFTRAALALWKGQPAYGSDLGTGIGNWFYSPSCGMFLFGPFALLPAWLGMTLFLAISWVVFVAGARELLVISGLSEERTQLFWGTLAPQMMLSLLTTKLEILMTGVLMLACAWLVQGRRVRSSALLLGIVTSWKFQLLPSAGLVAVVAWLLRRERRWPLLLLLGLGLSYFAPFVFRPAAELSAAHAAWDESLRNFISVAWLSFDNLFAFAHPMTGWPRSWGEAALVSAFLGAALAAGLALRVTQDAQQSGGHDAFPGAMLLALGFGAFFTVSFSPLNQNNGYVLWAPLVLAHLALTRGRLQAWIYGVAAGIMILAYSDLIPDAARSALRSHTVKPLAPLLLFSGLLIRRRPGQTGNN